MPSNMLVSIIRFLKQPWFLGMVACPQGRLTISMGQCAKDPKERGPKDSRDGRQQTRDTIKETIKSGDMYEQE
jgi:hypothetical protein